MPGNFASTTWTCAVSGTGSCGTALRFGQHRHARERRAEHRLDRDDHLHHDADDGGNRKCDLDRDRAERLDRFGQGNNSSTVSTTLSAPAAGSADLEMHIDSQPPATMNVGDTSTFVFRARKYSTTITPTNNIGVAFNVPANYTVTGWTCVATSATSDCDNSVAGTGATGGSGNTITLSKVDFTSAGNPAVTITVNVTAATAGTNLTATGSVSVPSGWTESYPSDNNKTSTATTINAASTSTDLSVSNSASASYTLNSATAVTMTMTNTGSNVASGAGWTASLPVNFTSTTWTCSVTGTGSCGTASGSGNTRQPGQHLAEQRRLRDPYVQHHPDHARYGIEHRIRGHGPLGLDRYEHR